MKFEKWICTTCGKNRPCVLNIPKDSSSIPLKCPLSPNDVAKSNWKVFNEDDKKIVNITLEGVTKLSYNGNINVEIPEDVIINIKSEK